MVMLQGFVDDSSSEKGDERLFLVAYINTVDRWEAFSDAWEEELGSLAYFKMVEANGLRGQFRGWSAADRDAKVMALAKIIEAHRPWFVFCSISRREYAEILAPTAPYGLKNPYFTCFWGVIKTTARYHSDLLGEGAPPVDFIFDEQGGVGHDAALWYKWLKSDEDAETQRILGSTPVFRDDKFVLPLQAADMLAWHLRREHEDGELDDRTILDILISGQGVGVHVPGDELRRIASRFVKVPNVAAVQTKSEWRKMVRSTQERLAAGDGPPSTNMAWMRYLAFRVRINRAWRSWRRMRQRLRRKR